MKALRTYISFIILIPSISFMGCKQKSNHNNVLAIKTPKIEVTPKQPLSQEFKDYWYAGKAEISSYRLQQARYGEIREGSAVLIYVTEDFLPDIQVKADNQSPTNIPVLKLNATKNFTTGIYPYSIMQSAFYPVANNQHALKVSSSIQEWCGHVYAQLNNKTQFEVMSHSYFQGEADEQFKLDKTILENELWAQLRLDPTSLPTGDVSIVPSLEFTRLKHIKIKPYTANITLSKGKYSITYKNLDRALRIYFNPQFPYDILSWEETFSSGGKKMTTKATKLKTITSPYWQKNSNGYEVLRDTLLLN